MFAPVAEKPTRRHALWISAVSLGGAGSFYWWRRTALQDALPTAGSSGEVSIAAFSPSGVRMGTTRLPKVVRSEAGWWDRLTPQQFYVTRRHTTDTPFTGTYYRNRKAGIYRCICCETALFSSQAKYDSGTGWPSFWAPIAMENVRALRPAAKSQVEALDIGIEVLCRRCDAHLGHIFGDGPPPTDLRYCINESALQFVGV